MKFTIVEDTSLSIITTYTICLIHATVWTRNTLTEASKNSRKSYLFPQKKFVSLLYAINIFNTIYNFKPTNLIVRRENAFCKFHTFFGFVNHVSCLPWFETKYNIRCINAQEYAFTHRNLPKSEKYIWIIQNVHEKSRFFYINITQ